MPGWAVMLCASCLFDVFGGHSLKRLRRVLGEPCRMLLGNQALVGPQCGDVLLRSVQSVVAVASPVQCGTRITRIQVVGGSGARLCQYELVERMSLENTPPVAML
eukprot:1434778-Amphidinium_carterae.1